MSSSNYSNKKTRRACCRDDDWYDPYQGGTDPIMEVFRDHERIQYFNEVEDSMHFRAIRARKKKNQEVRRKTKKFKSIIEK